MNIVNPNNNSLNSKYYNITLFDEINAESIWIRSLLFFHDNKLVLSTKNEANKNFLFINHVNNGILLSSSLTACLLDNSTIVTNTKGENICIGDHIIYKAHDQMVSKVIILPNNRIASCSLDRIIKIWNSVPPYSDTPLKVLKGHRGYVISLIYIKERDILISGSDDKSLRFWNMTTYQCVSIIKEVSCCDVNVFFQMDSNRIIIGERNQITILNVDKCSIENTIVDKELDYVSCFCMLRDKKTILCGTFTGRFCFYDIETNNHMITEPYHKSSIHCLLVVDEHTFISSSTDLTIKIWKY